MAELWMFNVAYVYKTCIAAQVLVPKILFNGYCLRPTYMYM